MECGISAFLHVLPFLFIDKNIKIDRNPGAVENQHGALKSNKITKFSQWNTEPITARHRFLAINQCDLRLFAATVWMTECQTDWVPVSHAHCAWASWPPMEAPPCHASIKCFTDPVMSSHLKLNTVPPPPIHSNTNPPPPPGLITNIPSPKLEMWSNYTAGPPTGYSWESTVVRELSLYK